VDLVQVEPVGAQPPQTVLDRLHDVAARAAYLHADIVHRHAEFRRQHDALAVVAEDFPHHGFRPAALAVSVGSIEQGNAEVERLVDYRPRGVIVDPGTEVVATQANGRDTQAGLAEVTDFHRR
jgi:hypothetical protein